MAFAPAPGIGNRALSLSGASHRDAAREREFRRARRHSHLVRLLKGVLPLAAAAILGLYALPSFLKKSIDHGRGTAAVKAITLEAGALKMIEPSVRGVNERGEPYEFNADTATQAAKGADIMYLEVVRGKLTGTDGKVSTLTAPDSIHNNKAEEMTFNNGAVVTRAGGMTATLQKAIVYMKQQTVISKTPVVVRLQESTILAESMTLNWSEGRAVFEGRVRTHIERQAEPSQAAPAK
jgi:lipopolysaccharide export system protein LptC